MALRHGRSFVGIELNPEYAAQAEAGIAGDAPLLNGVSMKREDGDGNVRPVA